MVGAILGALVLWRAIAGRDPEVVKPAAGASASASDEPSPRAPAPPRCSEIAEPFLVGDAPPTPKPAPVDPPEPGQPAEEPDDPTSPFAAEVGRGALFDGGFVVGAKRQGEGGAVAMVATLGLDGKGGKLVRVARLRGDLDPPVVAGAGRAIIAVMIEPNAGGRALRVAKVEGDRVTLGPELSEGRDDSLAIDVAASAQRAVVVWDDLTAQGKRSAIMLASIDVGTMRVTAPARPISAEGQDAERPRLIARPGGFWLSYAVRGSATKKKSDKHKRADEEDDRELGEAITTTWVELVPLDESGSPVGASRAVTAKSGHVLAYDIEAVDDGGALIVWRDDDTPTGSGGGRLLATVARLSGVAEPKLLAEETSAAGVPELIPGWLALASVNGGTRIAALSPRGELLDELEPEKSLGAGVPAAATREVILWARPLGKAMRLSVLKCAPRAVEARDGGAPDGG